MHLLKSFQLFRKLWTITSQEGVYIQHLDVKVAFLKRHLERKHWRRVRRHLERRFQCVNWREVITGRSKACDVEIGYWTYF